MTSPDEAAAPRPFSFSGTSSASYLDESQQPLQQPQTSQQQQQQRPHTSRFVEGSMSDRTSHAPPVSYLGGIGANRSRSRGRNNNNDNNNNNAQKLDRDDPYAHRQHQYSTRRSLQMARPSLSAFRTCNTAASTGTSASIASTNTTNTTATNATMASNNSSLRRPRSFLGPIWDGMTRRLHRRTRSTVEADMAKKREQEQEQQQQQQQQQEQTKGSVPMAGHLPGPMQGSLPRGDRLSPDEALANYQVLMQSGFFSKRAIPATRQGLASRGGTNSSSSSTGSAAGAAACPDRPPPPPPPPKSDPWTNGTPLSPVAPSPAGPGTITITPRGTKRARAAVDDGDDVEEGHQDGATTMTSRGLDHAVTGITSASPTRNSPRKLSKKLRKSPSIRSTPGQCDSVRSLRSMHNAAAAAAAAAEAEFGETSNNGRPSTAYSANGSMTSSSRSTRSHNTHAPVQVHQPLPPLPVSATTVPTKASNGSRVVSKKRKGPTRSASSEEERREHHTSDHQVAAAVAAIERRPSSSLEPKKKKRSQGPAAVVHQNRQNRGNVEVMIPDDKRKQNEEQEDRQDALRPPPTTHYHRTLGPLNPATPNRGGSNNNSHALLKAISSSSPQHQQQKDRQQPPISFHYPQRVRVRRPMQAQVVEVKASSTRSKVSSNGKNLLFREEDTENQVPVWQD